MAVGSGKFSLPSKSATLNFPCRRRSLKILGIRTCPESMEVDRSVYDALTQNAKARRDRWSREVDNIKTNRTELENIARPILRLTFPPKKRGRAMAGRGVTVAMTRQRATLGAFPRTRLTVRRACRGERTQTTKQHGSVSTVVTGGNLHLPWKRGEQASRFYVYVHEQQPEGGRGTICCGIHLRGYEWRNFWSRGLA